MDTQSRSNANGDGIGKVKYQKSYFCLLQHIYAVKLLYYHELSVDGWTNSYIILQSLQNNHPGTEKTTGDIIQWLFFEIFIVHFFFNIRGVLEININKAKKTARANARDGLCWLLPRGHAQAGVADAGSRIARQATTPRPPGLLVVARGGPACSTGRMTNPARAKPPRQARWGHAGAVAPSR